VCFVKFEDRKGNLRSALVRVPRKVPLTHGNIVKLVEQKSGHRVSIVREETCTTSKRSKSHALPRRRR
jgi:hypothetical protein